MKHFNEAEYFKRLKERIELFFGSFFEVCGIELQTLQEYHEFLDSSIEACVFPKELDSADYNILPIKEWFPATSRFIRSSLSRIRRRSPSPHLGLDAFEIKVNGFEDEKRLAIQRLRLADFEPCRTDLIDFKIESDDFIDLEPFFKEAAEFEERKSFLEKSLKSISYLTNTLTGCKSLITEISSILSNDTDFFFGDEIIQNFTRHNYRIDDNLDKIDENLKYPLSVQLDDVYSLTRGLNERIFALKYLDTAVCDQKRTCDQLAQIQSESIAAMDKAQGSLTNLACSSLAFDRKIAAKNAEIEKRIQKVEELSMDFVKLDEHVTWQLEKWEEISDTFLLERIKEIK